MPGLRGVSKFILFHVVCFEREAIRFRRAIRRWVSRFFYGAVVGGGAAHSTGEW
jgi:hypothetical protein